MTIHEFTNWFNEHVKPRWPKWKINKFDVGDWYAAFGKYSLETLTTAVMKLRTHEAGASPNTKKLLEIVKAISPPKPKARDTVDEDEGMLMPIKEIEANFAKLYPLKNRVKMIAILHKIGRDAKAIDEEAFKIACEKGLIKEARRTCHFEEESQTTTRQSKAVRLGDCFGAVASHNDSKKSKTEAEKEQARLNVLADLKSSSFSNQK